MFSIRLHFVNVLNLLPLTGMETYILDFFNHFELYLCFKSLSPHGDGNKYNTKPTSSHITDRVLNLLPLTGMETIIGHFLLEKLPGVHRFKSLTPHGDGNFRGSIYSFLEALKPF